MNYYEWSEEYFLQAERLQGRAEEARWQARLAVPEKAETLRRRAAILDDMYRECLYAGRVLRKRAAHA